jgi:hypothetical protein
MAMTMARNDMPRTANVEKEELFSEEEMAFMDVADETITEASETIRTNSADVDAILASIDLNKLIEERIAAALSDTSTVRGNPIVDATQREKKTVTPERYLKHYRCDVAPEISIQLRNYDEGSDSLSGVVKGKRMNFRRGHFFATTQEEVDQIEWMMKHPSLDPTDSSRVIGGNPHIYEDDGRDLVQCAYCSEVFVSGSNALKSHLRATHGVAI